MEKEIFSIAEVAKLLDLHEHTVRKAIREGRLKAAKIGTDYRISKFDLSKFWLDAGGGILFEETSNETKENPDEQQN